MGKAAESRRSVLVGEFPVWQGWGRRPGFVWFCQVGCKVQKLSVLGVQNDAFVVESCHKSFLGLERRDNSLLSLYSRTDDNSSEVIGLLFRSFCQRVRLHDLFGSTYETAHRLPKAGSMQRRL